MELNECFYQHLLKSGGGGEWEMEGRKDLGKADCVSEN